MTMIENPQERRAQQRNRCLKAGRVILANGNSTVNCRVRNESESGLRLITDEARLIPAAFSFVNDQTQQVELCEIAWRKGPEVGAKIIAQEANAYAGGTATGSSKSAAGKRAHSDNVMRYPV